MTEGNTERERRVEDEAGAASPPVPGIKATVPELSLSSNSLMVKVMLAVPSLVAVHPSVVHDGEEPSS